MSSPPRSANVTRSRERRGDSPVLVIFLTPSGDPNRTCGHPHRPIASTPRTLLASTAATDAVWTGTLMVIWGGQGGSYLATGGRYDPVTDTWTPTSASAIPSARRGHTAVWTGSLMVVWGFYHGPYGPFVNTGGRYNPLTDTWTPTSTASAPIGRYAHTAIWTERMMIVWGGRIGINLSSNGGRYVGGPPVPEVATDLDFIDAETVAWSASASVDLRRSSE